MASDPVCGMHVDEYEAAGGVQYEGRQYFFCCEHCFLAFEKSPAQYVNATSYFRNRMVGIARRLVRTSELDQNRGGRTFSADRNNGP